MMSRLPPIMKEDFIDEFNKNKPSQEFFDVCKKAGELIKIKNFGEILDEEKEKLK